MTNYGQPQFKFSVSSASGTTVLQNISNYVTALNGINIEAITEQSDAFGDSWVEFLWTGVRKLGEVVIDGFYDDTAASGPHALLGDAAAIGAYRTIEADFGASDIINIPVVVSKYERMPSRGALTKYRCTFLPTGAPTTAT